MKKKLFSVLTVFLLAMALCACTSGSVPGDEAGSGAEAGTAEPADAGTEAGDAESGGTAATDAETEAGDAESGDTAATDAGTEAGTAAATEAEADDTSSAETAFPEAETASSGGLSEEAALSSILEGEFTGWADSHTVEVIVEDAPTAFQVQDEGVKAILESFEEGTVFSFETVEENGMRMIVGLLQG